MSAASLPRLELAPKTSERLRKLAEESRRAPSALVEEAVEQYVDREEKRAAFHAAGMEAWRQYQATGLHLTEAEADARLARLEAGEVVDPPPCHD